MKAAPIILTLLPLLKSHASGVFLLESLHPEWKSRHRKCLKATGKKERPRLVDCDPKKSNQQWLVDDIERSQFRPVSKPSNCLAINLIVMKECKDADEDGYEKQIWEYDPSSLWMRIISKDLCMDSRDLFMRPCSYASDKSLWKLVPPDEYGPENEEGNAGDDEGSSGGNDKIDQTAYKLDLDGEKEFCLSAANLDIKSKIKMKRCNDLKQKRKNVFVMDQNTETIRPYYAQDLCFEVSKVVEGKSLRLNKCSQELKRRQQWKWNMDAYDDPIKPRFRSGLCIAHTTGGDRSRPECGCDGCNTRPCAGDKIKLFDAATRCKDPMNQWYFRKVDPEDL